MRKSWYGEKCISSFIIALKVLKVLKSFKFDMLYIIFSKINVCTWKLALQSPNYTFMRKIHFPYFIVFFCSSSFSQNFVSRVTTWFRRSPEISFFFLQFLVNFEESLREKINDSVFKLLESLIMFVEFKRTFPKINKNVIWDVFSFLCITWIHSSFHILQIFHLIIA